MASPVSEPAATRIKLPSISVRKRILVADDNVIVRSVVRALIEAGTDLEVCNEAVDGLNAIQKAKELKPDLVLLDFRTPGLSGRSCLDHQERLATSAHRSVHLVRAICEQGDDDSCWNRLGAKEGGWPG